MPVSFSGLRVTSFESRRASEMCALIERLGGVARSAPSMRELPNPESPTAMQFAERLLAGEFDVVILLTGVGAKALLSIVEQRHDRRQVLDALARTVIVARGPKPVAQLREWGLKANFVAPEPNTWRDLLKAIDAGLPLTGKRVALQEYGESNAELIAALRERGAEVFVVAVYAWALPEDLQPLREAIQALADGQTDAVTFTSAQQVRHVLQVAQEMGLQDRLRDGLRRTVIGSIGPTTSETLTEEGLGFDFEPDRVKMGDMIRGLARSAGELLQRKRFAHAAGIDTSKMKRIHVVWPSDNHREGADPLHESAFLKACRREKTPYTPVWIMRQAGRFLREYRELREKVSFLQLCKTPELAAEVTLMAVDRLGVDAAIIFSDILLITEPMGLGLTFDRGDGPRFDRPIRTREDIRALRNVDPQSLGFVYDAIRLTRRALRPDLPLIGFCGAPFTLASYMIEGGSSKHFIETKSLMYRDPAAWHDLLGRIAWACTEYLNCQIEAGVQAVQLFDSWVGTLSAADYREFVFPHTRFIVEHLRPGAPVIYFGTDTAALLGQMKQTGVDVIGMDWRVNLAEAWHLIGEDIAVQGNLDPALLLASTTEITRRAHAILSAVAGRPGHIFNLGHGVLPETPVDHVQALIDAVHEYRSPQ